MAFFDLPLNELTSYRPEVAEPEDFDAFWKQTIDEARGHDLNVRLERFPSPLSLIETYDLTFAGFGGQDVRGWLFLPAGTDEPIPAVVQYHGYSGGRGMPLGSAFVNAGYAHFVLDTRGQGWNSASIFDLTPDLDAAAGENGIPGHMTHGILAPKDYYYRRLFTDVARFLEVANEHALVDSSRIFVQGGSQGGAMTIAAAGLASLVEVNLAGAMPDVPFMCHFERAITLTDANPYKEISNYLAARVDAGETVLRTLSYFDGVNFAKRAATPTLFSVALMDQICPPSTVYAAFNVWASKQRGKTDSQIHVYAHNGHEGGREVQTWRQLQWLQSILGDKDEAPARKPARRARKA